MDSGADVHGSNSFTLGRAQIEREATLVVCKTRQAIELIDFASG
jgi:hypothetical protein